MSGYLCQVDARLVGEASVLLGAGRAKKGDPVDHAVGIMVHHKVGDYLESGQPLFTLYANQKPALEEARWHLAQAIEWSESPVEPLPLFYDVVRWTDRAPAQNPRLAQVGFHKASSFSGWRENCSSGISPRVRRSKVWLSRRLTGVGTPVCSPKRTTAPFKIIYFALAAPAMQVDMERRHLPAAPAADCSRSITGARWKAADCG